MTSRIEHGLVGQTHALRPVSQMESNMDWIRFNKYCINLSVQSLAARLNQNRKCPLNQMGVSYSQPRASQH